MFVFFKYRTETNICVFYRHLKCGRNQFYIPKAKYFPRKNIFCSVNKDKLWGEIDPAEE